MNNIERFLSSPAYAVAGASNDRHKYGNKILRCYIQHKMKVYPINLTAQEIEGVECLSTVQALPPSVKSLSIVTPPPITEKIVMQALAKGQIENIWMQPGAESEAAIQACTTKGVNIIAHGPCLLVTLGFQE